MDPVQEILVDALEITTLCCGLAGMLLSLGLALMPPGTSTAARLMNRRLNVEKGLMVLDRTYPLDRFFFRYNRVGGFLLVAGSLFAGVFLFLGLDPGRLMDTVPLLPEHPDFNAMLYSAMVLAGKIGCSLGVFLGLVLILAPKRVESITRAMDSSLSTTKMVERLNTYHYGFDRIITRFPRLFGTLGFVASSVLVFLSALNMLE
jgi:hypothetical protein